MDISLAMGLTLVLSLLAYTQYCYAQGEPNTSSEVLDLVPLVLPNVTFCETTLLGLNDTSFEFRWTLTGLQNYYETVRKFYDSVYFTKTSITRGNGGGTQLLVNVKVGVSGRSLTAMVDISPYNEMVVGASFEGQLHVKSRHGNATYSSNRVTQLADVMQFKWYLAQAQREELGRLLEIYTDAVVTNPIKNSTILPNREKHKQAVTLVFKIIRYGISPVLEASGGLQRCSKEDYN